MNRQSKATKAITSNGIAPRTAAVSELLRTMHPQREVPLRLHKPIRTQQNPPLEACAKQIRNRASAIQASVGFYGWAPWLFHWIQSSSLDHPFIAADAKFTAAAAAGDLPPAICYLMTCASLAPFNKIPQPEQDKLTAEGKDIKIRPVCNSDGLLKSALRMATRTASCKKAIKACQPQQFGAGVQGGTEIVSHAVRAMHEKGYAILTIDAINGFNALKRQAMLDAVANKWQPGVKVINAFYGLDTPAFFVYTHENGTRHISSTLSTEGARMGDVFGSIGFDLSIDNTYKTLAAEFLTFPIAALTDDMPTCIPPPEDATGWADRFNEARKLLARYDALANPLGMHRHPAKGQLLVPPGTACHDRPDPALAHIELNFTEEGVVIAGAPIGTNVFTSAYADSKVDIAISRIDATLRLATEDPQIATQLLSTSANAALDYLVRVTPTALIGPAISRFDEHMKLAIMSITETKLHTCPPRTQSTTVRATDLATLPADMGGLGLTRLSHKAPIAFLTSVRGLMKHPFLKPHVAALEHYLRLSFTSIAGFLSMTGPSLDPRQTVSAVLPASAERVLDPSHLARAKRYKNQRAGPFGIILNAVHANQRMNLRLSAMAVPPTPLLPMEDSEALHLLSVTARSQLTRVVKCPLWKWENRIPPADFVIFLRFYLLLPRPHVWREPCRVPNSDQFLEPCGCCHANGMPYIDHRGNHAASCVSTRLARSNLHNKIRDIYAKYAKRAGAMVDREPSAASLFDGQFSPKHLATMLPRSGSATAKRAAERMKTLLTTEVPNAKSQAELAGLLKEVEALATMTIGSAASDELRDLTLRLDINIRPPDGGKHLWVDVTTRHCSAISYRKPSLKFFRAELQNELLAKSNGGGNIMCNEISPALNRASTAKHHKYAPLLALANLQKQRGLLPPRRQQILMAPAFAHHGEMSREAFDLIEQLTRILWRRESKMPPRPDGLGPKALTAQFRKNIKDELAVAVATGVARMLTMVGAPA